MTEDNLGVDGATNEPSPTSLNQKDAIDDILREIHEGDSPEKLWDQTVSLARDEEKIGKITSNYSDISTDEIVEMGEKIQKLYN